MSPDPVIETNQLTKRYGAQAAVDHVDLRVESGEVFGFLGPNGAGKTTTLRMLLGLVRPSSGSARVLGGSPGSPRVLSRIGMLVESPGFYPYMSGRDNLRVVSRYARLALARVDEVLELVDLASRGRDHYSTYSLGMKQRLGVAAALLKDPELLILDEPTNGLDPAGIAEMRSLIRRLGSGSRTVLLSSHLLGEVEQICDRVGVISHGRLLREGAVGDLRGRPTLVIAADPPEAARAVAERILGAEAVVQEDNHLRLNAEPGSSAGINRQLVLAGVSVHTIEWKERSLEAAFFELTGNGGAK
jgi:ABC-type multidrug transport system ATPase subunit